MTPSHEHADRDRREAWREIGAATRLLTAALASAGLTLLPSTHRGHPQRSPASAEPGITRTGGLPPGILAADDHLRRAVKALHEQDDAVAALHEASEAYAAVDAAWGELVAGRALQRLADQISTQPDGTDGRPAMGPSATAAATGELLAAYSAYRQRHYLTALHHIERGHTALHRPTRDVRNPSSWDRAPGPVTETPGEDHLPETAAHPSKEVGLG
jgi:hypothetical protein